MRRDDCNDSRRVQTAHALAVSRGRRSLVDVRSRSNFAAAKNTPDARGSQEAHFRAVRCGTVRLESGRWRGQVGGPRVPSDLPAAKNLLRLPDSKTDNIIDVVKHGRSDKNQAIEPIENAAVSRNEFRGVLETEITFDRGKHQIAELPHYADNDAKSQQAHWCVEGCAGPDEMPADRNV